MNTKGFKRIEQQEARKRAKRALVNLSVGKTPNELAEQMTGCKAFTRTPEWIALRAKVLETYGRTCMKCNATPRVINVDHIKPRRFYPNLALVFDNLQVLCARCNKAKGNKHCTDYRPPITQPKALAKIN